jgi:hypothetical protein
MDDCKWSFDRSGKHREFILPGPFAKANGKLVCQDCLKFLGWHEIKAQEKKEDLDNPIEPATDEEKTTLYILVKGQLPEWEAKFVSDLMKKEMWSKKQRKIFERLCNQYIKVEKTSNEQLEPTTSESTSDFEVPF